MSNITTSLFQEMVQAGLRLNKQAEYVNSLNVFPVPDGDTGTNMGNDHRKWGQEVSDRSASTVGEAAGIFAKGLLMGARGNSGVITSQLFRGFSPKCQRQRRIGWSSACSSLPIWVEVAYKAVVRSQLEGNHFDGFSWAAIGAKKKQNLLMMQWKSCVQLLKEPKTALAKTPDMLPVLKEVGVVDSGGQGWSSSMKDSCQL